MGICWSCFTWDAFATLLTGVLAVAGAVWVGLRQTKILDRQTRLADLTFKSDLFEKRAAVFEATAEFLAEILRQAAYPDRDREVAFIHAMGQARFLFGAGVHDGLEEIRKRALNLAALKREMESTFAREGHYGDGNPDREYELLRWFDERFRTLTDLFGDALRLA